MTSSNNTQIFLILLTIVLSSSTIFAQHNHGSHQRESMHDMNMKQAPHGGDMKDVGKYKVEMVADLFLKEDQLVFYLFKRNLKAISTEGTTGTLMFINRNGTSTHDTLISKGNSYFVAQLENKEGFQVVVNFLIKDKIFSTEYSHPGLGLHSLGKYYCTMHSDIETNIPGECPKCGMKLTPKVQIQDKNQHLDHEHIE